MSNANNALRALLSQQSYGQEPVGNVPSTDRPVGNIGQAPDQFRDDPAPETLSGIFKAKFKAGQVSTGADLAAAQAGLQTLLGNNVRANQLLEKSRAYQTLSARNVEGLQTYAEFLQDPSFGGFVEQATGAVGNTLPSVINTLAGAAAGTVVAATLPVTGSVAGASATAIGSTAVVKKLLKKAMINTAKGTATKSERSLAQAAYAYGRQGAWVGAGAAEYPLMAGSNISEAVDDVGLDLNRATVARAAGLAVPQVAVSLVGEKLIVDNLFNSFKKVAAERAAKSINKQGRVTGFLNGVGTVGKGLGQGAIVEGLAETTQEGMGIANRFGIDDTYTAQEAKLRLAEAAFAGFMAGGAVGGTGTAVSQVGLLGKGGVRKGAEAIGNLPDDNPAVRVARKTKELLGMAASQQAEAEVDSDYVGNLDGTVVPESEAQIDAQIDQLGNPANVAYDSVWLSKDQKYAGVDPAETYGDYTVTRIPASKNSPELFAVHIPGEGTLITTDRTKAQAILDAALRQAVTGGDLNYDLFPDNSLEESIKDALGFTHTKAEVDPNPDNQLTVQVKDAQGNIIREQVTDTTKNANNAVVNALVPLMPKDGTIDTIDNDTLLVNRINENPNKVETIEVTKPLDIDDFNDDGEYVGDQVNDGDNLTEVDSTNTDETVTSQTGDEVDVSRRERIISNDSGGFRPRSDKTLLGLFDDADPAYEEARAAFIEAFNRRQIERGAERIIQGVPSDTELTLDFFTKNAQLANLDTAALNAWTKAINDTDADTEVNLITRRLSVADLEAAAEKATNKKQQDTLKQEVKLAKAGKEIIRYRVAIKASDNTGVIYRGAVKGRKASRLLAGQQLSAKEFIEQVILNSSSRNTKYHTVLIVKPDGKTVTATLSDIVSEGAQLETETSKGQVGRFDSNTEVNLRRQTDAIFGELRMQGYDVRTSAEFIPTKATIKNTSSILDDPTNVNTNTVKVGGGANQRITLGDIYGKKGREPFEGSEGGDFGEISKTDPDTSVGPDGPVQPNRVQENQLLEELEKLKALKNQASQTLVFEATAGALGLDSILNTIDANIEDRTKKLSALRQEDKLRTSTTTPRTTTKVDKKLSKVQRKEIFTQAKEVKKQINKKEAALASNLEKTRAAVSNVSPERRADIEQKVEAARKEIENLKTQRQQLLDQLSTEMDVRGVGEVDTPVTVDVNQNLEPQAEALKKDISDIKVAVANFSKTIVSKLDNNNIKNQGGEQIKFMVGVETVTAELGGRTVETVVPVYEYRSAQSINDYAKNNADFSTDYGDWVIEQSELVNKLTELNELLRQQRNVTLVPEGIDTGNVQTEFLTDTVVDSRIGALQSIKEAIQKLGKNDPKRQELLEVGKDLVDELENEYGRKIDQIKQNPKTETVPTTVGAGEAKSEAKVTPVGSRKQQVGTTVFSKAVSNAIVKTLVPLINRLNLAGSTEIFAISDVLTEDGEISPNFNINNYTRRQAEVILAQARQIQAGAGGRYVGFIQSDVKTGEATSDTRHIIMYDDKSNNPYFEANAIAHELGHAFQEEEKLSIKSPLRNAGKQKIWNDFLKQREEGDINAYKQTDINAAFDEYFADNIAKAGRLYFLEGVGRNAAARGVPTNFIQSFFKRIVNKMMQMYKRISDPQIRKRFGAPDEAPSPAFSEFLEESIRSREGTRRTILDGATPSKVNEFIKNLEGLTSKVSPENMKSLYDWIGENILSRKFFTNVSRILMTSDNILRGMVGTGDFRDPAKVAKLQELGRRRDAINQALSEGTTSNFANPEKRIEILQKRLEKIVKEGEALKAEVLAEAKENRAKADLAMGTVGERIANMFEQPSQSAEQFEGRLGMLRQANLTKNEFRDKLDDLIGLDWTTDAVQDGFKEAASGTPTAQLKSDVAKKIRGFLADMHRDYVSQAKHGIDIPFQENYFPISIGLEKVAQDPQKFISAIVNDLEKNGYEYDEVKIRKAVNRMLAYNERITNDDVEIEPDPNDPFATAESPKELTKNVDPAAIKEFLDEPDAAFISYVSRMVKRVEWAKATKDVDGNDLLQPLLNQLSKNDQEHAIKIIKAYLGFTSEPLSPIWQTINSWGQFFNFVTLLPLAAFSSLVDFAGPIMQSKDFNGFRMQMRNVMAAMTDKQKAQLGRDVGIATRDSIATTLISESEADYMNKKARDWSNKFFTWNGLNYLTRFTREFAASMSVRFMLDHSGLSPHGVTEGDPGYDNSTRYLAELGVTRKDVKTWEDSGRDFNTPEGKKVKRAIQRFTESSIMRPNAAQRPLWASDPKWILVWQLKSFFYAYGKTIIGGLYRTLKNRQETFRDKDGNLSSEAYGDLAKGIGFQVALLGGMTLPLAMLGLELREYAKTGLSYVVPGESSKLASGERTPVLGLGTKYFKTDEMEWGEYLGEILDRTGVFGTGHLYAGISEANKWGDSRIIAAFGPTAQLMEQWAQATWNGNFGPAVDRMIPIKASL